MGDEWWEIMHWRGPIRENKCRIWSQIAASYISCHSSSCLFILVPSFYISLWLPSLVSHIIFTVRIRDKKVTPPDSIFIFFFPAFLTLSLLPPFSKGWLAVWVDMWGRWRSRPVPSECGILIWAICNDRPPMGAEEWQVERLWQVLIAVRKRSWRMCQLHPLPFRSSPVAVVPRCLSVFLSGPLT